MPASFKWSIQKSVHYFLRHIQGKKPSGKRQNIDVVMRPGQTGDFHVPTQSRANTGMFVERDVNPVSTAANADASLHLSPFDGFG
jgi:hypothetical protein